HDASRLAGGEGHRHASDARALGDDVSHQQGVLPQVEVSALDGFWPTPENRETRLEPERGAGGAVAAERSGAAFDLRTAQFCRRASCSECRCLRDPASGARQRSAFHLPPPLREFVAELLLFLARGLIHQVAALEDAERRSEPT